MGEVVVECLKRSGMTDEQLLAARNAAPITAASVANMPDAIRRDLAANPVQAGSRRVYNKAFKMPVRS